MVHGPQRNVNIHPLTFRPNGSSQQPSPFISNISSMLNRYLEISIFQKNFYGNRYDNCHTSMSHTFHVFFPSSIWYIFPRGIKNSVICQHEKCFNLPKNVHKYLPCLRHVFFIQSRLTKIIISPSGSWAPPPARRPPPRCPPWWRRQSSRISWRVQHRHPNLSLTLLP